jgi:two-component system, LytTR family, sensor kinase
MKGKDLTFPSYWRLQVTGWLGLFPLMLAVGLTAGPFRLEMLRDVTIRWGTWFGLSNVLRGVCRSLLRRSLGWFQLELRAFGWSLLVGIFAAILLHAPNVWLGFHHILGAVTRDSVQSSILLLLWCNLYLSIKQFQQSVQEHARLIRAEADAREARLSALRYQLNPHFLFNSLNAVSTLAVKGNVPAATRMLSQIADLLRRSLDTRLGVEVALSEEMVFTERYLAIEQNRLGDRLQVDLAISAETRNAAVPSMLLQPLVENAIRHGIAPVVEGGKVGIHSRLNGTRLQIAITNTGPRAARPAKNSNSIGLTNTTERLQTLYGDNHTMNLHWPDSGGCEVLIEIPFRRASHQEELACAY